MKIEVSLLILIASVLLLNGCSPALPDHLDTYQQRLANVLDTAEPADIAMTPLEPFPQTGKPANELTISLNAFYQLSDCSLYSLVAERNTTLGRLQAPSRRYHYEQQLLKALKACAQQSDDGSLKSKLAQWHRLKQEQIVESWQWLLSSRELRQGLSRNQGWLEPKQQAGETRAAWQYLTQLQPPSPAEVDLSALEQHLKHIADRHLISRIVRSQHYLARQLPPLTHWLNEHQPDCDTTTARYLRNVFGRFFIENIQPVGGRINHFHYQLSPPLEALYMTPQQPEAIRQWLNTHWFGGFNRYQAAMQSHIKWWQGFLARCELAPPSFT